MSQTHDIDPDLLAELESERSYATTSGNYAERLKLDKGCGAIIRFLPVHLGKNKSWFARSAMHWNGKRPVNCPRHTAPAAGGNPDAVCPVCDAIERLIEENHGNDEVVKKLESTRVWPKYLTYVLVLETIDRHGEATARGRKARLVPHEFWITKNGFIELSNIFRRSLKWSPSQGFVDPIAGCDIQVNNDNRNMLKFELVGRGPLRDDMEGDELIRWTETACRNIKVADYKPSSQDKLEEFALKLEDIAGRPGARGASRRATLDDNLDGDDLPPPRRQALDDDDAVPVRRGAARQPDDDAPPPRRQPVDDAPPPRRQAVTEDDAPPARRSAAAEEDAPPPPARRSNPPVQTPPPRREAQPLADDDLDDDPPPSGDDNPDLDDAPPPPPAASTARRLAPPPAAQTNKAQRPPPAPDRAPANQEDDLAPERGHGVDPAEDLPPVPPPQTKAVQAPGTSRLSQDMRSRLRDL